MNASSSTSKYGIVRLSIVAVRANASHQSEQITQLLFGDHYEVTDQSKDGKWYKIVNYFDQYEGWIDAQQYHFISPEYFVYINQSELKITTDITSSLLYNKSPQLVLMGSIIPISSSELFKMEEQFAFNGESKNAGQKREFEFLKNIAFKYLNAPYLWGGKTPIGIDCSGLTQMVFKICGYKLLRDARQQANQGKLVDHMADVLPGDLAFFQNEEGKIVHVGVMLEPDKIIHASGKVHISSFDKTGILHSDMKTYTHKLAHLRRILPEVV